MRPPAVKIVRARQRDRASSLPGFDRNFPPQTREWGIDKLQLKLTGRWRTSLSSGPAFFEQRLTDANLAWLRRPQSLGNTISVESVQSPPLTLSRLKVSATRCSGSEGGIIVDLSVNPTRTLASLIARIGNQSDFRARILIMDCLTFFGVDAVGALAVPPSLDDADNYLPENPSPRELLGDDPFNAFMPIFLGQLQFLLGRVLSEHSGGLEIDGGEQVISSADGSIRLDWATASAPQIETYFERFHRNAVAAVRGAATSILDADTATRVTLYPAYQVQPELERSVDRLSLTAAINVTVDNRHTLSVYAKTPTRIRFEVRRHRRGRYTNHRGSVDRADRASYLQRLLHILLDVERHDAYRLIQWHDLFGFFEEPDIPVIGDLAYVMGAIFRAANGSSELFNLLTERLIIDGGFAVGVDGRITRSAIAHLERAGVIEKGRIRHRHTPSQIARYRLVGPYRSLRERMLVGVAARGDQA